MKRMLITGAAGGLGSMLRGKLVGRWEALRLSDISDLGSAGPGEELVKCDLCDRSAVDALVAGCDGIIHLGGISVEDSWSAIRGPNIEGLVNVYEAARANGHPRILFASSNHAIGYYRQDQMLDANVPTRPDGYYGVSKVFGEAIAHMYHDKFGQETAIVRLGSCFPEPRDHRMLATWLSPDDFVRLIDRVFDVPRLGCPVIYGVSANDAIWWDNRSVGYLGWKPQDNSERFRAQLDAKGPPPPGDAPAATYQGGIFTAYGIYPDEEG